MTKRRKKMMLDEAELWGMNIIINAEPSRIERQIPGTIYEIQHA